jgi:hypothetical protein
MVEKGQSSMKEVSAKTRRSNLEHYERVLAKKVEEGWQYFDEFHGAGLPLVKGRRFRVMAHKPGWYKFNQHVINPKGSEWIECYGPFTKSGLLKRGPGFHAFHPDSILQVERKVKDPVADRKARKEAELN